MRHNRYSYANWATRPERAAPEGTNSDHESAKGESTKDVDCLALRASHRTLPAHSSHASARHSYRESQSRGNEPYFLHLAHPFAKLPLGPMRMAGPGFRRTTAFTCRAGCKELDASKNRNAGPVKCNALFGVFSHGRRIDYDNARPKRGHASEVRHVEC